AALSPDDPASTCPAHTTNEVVAAFYKLNCPNPYRRFADTTKRRSSRGRSAPFEQMNLNAAGIDVGATEHWVAVPEDRDEEPVRRFGAFTADLYALAAWLQQCQIETVVLEFTGVSWITLFA